jgi:crotonobetainyl-CoA:carnitine CoA-transferase CaiB-like acyl-CoA transferase
MFRQLTLSECERRFGSADCCFAPAMELAQAITSPHMRSRGLVPHTAEGDYQPLFPALIDDEPPAPRPPLREE